MINANDLMRDNRIMLRAEVAALTRERDAQAERIRALQAHIVLVQDQNDELRKERDRQDEIVRALQAHIVLVKDQIDEVRNERDALTALSSRLVDRVAELEVENDELREKVYKLASEFRLESHWEDHPLFPNEEWLHAVARGDTRQSYQEWVKDQVDALYD